MSPTNETRYSLFCVQLRWFVILVCDAGGFLEYVGKCVEHEQASSNKWDLGISLEYVGGSSEYVGGIDEGFVNRVRVL